MKKIIIANWKMNPINLREAKVIFKGIKKQALKSRNAQTVICPSSVYISELKKMYSGKKILLGAQDCFDRDKGAFTGETSPGMLKSAGADFVILGHSERREAGENNKIISQKAKLALRDGLKVILCVGEKERDEEGNYFRFLKKQILDVLDKIGRDYLKDILIAYEPVWAVGKKAQGVITGEQLREIVVFIRKILVDKYGVKNFDAVRILYGGSVDYKNAEELAESGVDGFLVGRESLNAEKFGKILEIMDKR